MNDIVFSFCCVIFSLYNRIKNKVIRYRNRWVFKGADYDHNLVTLGSEVPEGFVLVCPENLKIGIGSVLNGNCFINATGGVEIGRYCHIAQGLTVYSHNHNYQSTKYIPYDGEVVKKRVVLGDAVWIGANVTFLPGAKVGNGAIVSAGSLVSGEIPDCAIVRGNPAAVVGYRDESVFKALYSENRFF